jgi:hypothetical protein
MTLQRVAVAVLMLVVLVTGCGGSEVNRTRVVASQLRARLIARDLPPRWVVCVPTRTRLHGLTAYRCNVNFGDPHIEAYCAVLSPDRLAYAEWRQPVQGRQNRVASQRECVRRLSGRLG